MSSKNKLSTSIKLTIWKLGSERVFICFVLCSNVKHSTTRDRLQDSTLTAFHCYIQAVKSTTGFGFFWYEKSIRFRLVCGLELRCDVFCHAFSLLHADSVYILTNKVRRSFPLSLFTAGAR